MTARLPDTFTSYYRTLEPASLARADSFSSAEKRSDGEQNALGKRNVLIDLRRPFEEVVSATLSLPWGDAGSENLMTEAELRRFLRGLFEAANGRQVETIIGLIPIAPPVAEFLKATPYQVTDRIDFLIQVAMRILSGPDDFVNEIEMSENHE
jgi:hypothetical protein